MLIGVCAHAGPPADARPVQELPGAAELQGVPLAPQVQVPGGSLYLAAAAGEPVPSAFPGRAAMAPALVHVVQVVRVLAVAAFKGNTPAPCASQQCDPKTFAFAHTHAVRSGAWAAGGARAGDRRF